jgi:ribosomal protein S18 acetylase RimI-like enzyme
MKGTNDSQTGKFIIRPYKQGDFDEVSSLWEATGMGNSKRGDNEAIILSSIKMGGNFLIIGEEITGKIAGTCWMTFDGRRIHLHHFGIHPGYQGKGLASMLLGESLKFVKDKGYQVKLEVNASNYKAINLYKKYGFEYLGDYDVYIIRDLTKIS